MKGYQSGVCSALLWKTAGTEQFKGRVCVSLGTLDDADLMNEPKPEKEFYTGMRTTWVPEIMTEFPV